MIALAVAAATLSLGAQRQEQKTNLLFHASLDGTLRADVARGEAEPVVAVNIPGDYIEGKVGKAIVVVGGVQLAYPAKDNVNPGSGSVLLWVKPQWQGKGPDELGEGSRGILDCGTEAGDNSDIYVAYFPHIPGIGVTFDRIGKAELHRNPTPWAADEWHHVALTWHCEQGISLYCDGVEVMHKTINWRPRAVSPQFSVGAGFSLRNPIRGVVDELFVYDRPLSKEEVLLHMNWTGGDPPAVPYEQPHDKPVQTLIEDPNYLSSAQQNEPLAPRPEIYDLEHSILHYDKKWYCGHPRQGIFAYFGGGEIVVGHNHAPCNYEAPSDVAHDLGGYHSRAVMLLQRSTDGGATWPQENDVVIYDETMTTEQKRALLYPKDAPRDPYDMFRPESIFFFGRTYLPEDRDGTPVCFALRSPDKGNTWEKVPTIVRHPDGETVWVHKDCHPVARTPDGKTLLAGMSIAEPGGPGVYASMDSGLTWSFLSRAGWDRSGQGRFTYVGLLLMPDGELQCYSLHIASGDPTVDGIKNAICLFRSHDGGKTWSEPVPIVGKGGGCWKNPGDSGNIYRSPWPMLLQDGRILVVFGRRRVPMGIGGVISSDGGKTWSEEFVIRDDGIGGDLGYPVGCQLDDGRIFIAYYYTMADGNGFGGTRYIAGSRFRIR